MSKLMSDLNSLKVSRSGDSGILIENAPEIQEQNHFVPEYKGIYFLSFLMVLLIGFSVVSMSISLKTFTQLEGSWADSKAILETLNKQQKDIVALKELISDSASEELARFEDLGNRVNELKVAVESGKNEISEIKIAYINLKESLKDSINDLELADAKILNKFTTLNDHVQEMNEENLLNFNAY